MNDLNVLKALRKDISDIQEVVHDGINHYYKDCFQIKNEAITIINKYIEKAGDKQ